MYSRALTNFIHVMTLIHSYLTGMRHVYLGRHALSRIVIQWRHLKGRQPSTRDFSSLMNSRRLSYLVVGWSVYHELLRAFRKFYPDNQIHCITSEEPTIELRPTLTALLSFLGASTDPEHLALLLDDGALPQVNEAGDHGNAMMTSPAWTDKLLSQVPEVVRPDAEQMLSYMGKPLDSWDL